MNNNKKKPTTMKQVITNESTLHTSSESPFNCLFLLHLTSSPKIEHYPRRRDAALYCLHSTPCAKIPEVLCVTAPSTLRPPPPPLPPRPNEFLGLSRKKQRDLHCTTRYLVDKIIIDIFILSFPCSFGKDLP